MRRPKPATEWHARTANVKRHLGLLTDAGLNGVVDIYVDSKLLI